MVNYSGNLIHMGETLDHWDGASVGELPHEELTTAPLDIDGDGLVSVAEDGRPCPGRLLDLGGGGTVPGRRRRPRRRPQHHGVFRLRRIRERRHWLHHHGGDRGRRLREGLFRCLGQGRRQRALSRGVRRRSPARGGEPRHAHGGGPRVPTGRFQPWLAFGNHRSQQC